MKIQCKVSGLVVSAVLALAFLIVTGKDAIDTGLAFRTLIVSREASLLFHFVVVLVVALFWLVLTVALILAAVVCSAKENEDAQSVHGQVVKTQRKARGQGYNNE